MRKLATVAVVLLVAAAGAEAKKRKPAPKPKRMVVVEAPEGDLFATLRTSAGDIIIKLYEKDAPKTVETFVGLATGKKEWKDPTTQQWVTGQPLYDGTWFHRVLPGFMIQGGDPYTRSGGDPAQAGHGGPGFKFEDEIPNGHTFDKGGYLAMANGGPNSNGSQFFVTEVATPHLDGHHTIFGEVVSGQELVKQIADAGDMKTELKQVAIQRGKLAPQK